MNKYIVLFGWVALVTGYLTFLGTFMLAYGVEGKAITVYINHYGEADLEFIFFFFSIPAVIYLFYNIDKLNEVI